LVYNQPFPDFAATETANARCRYPAHVFEPIIEADGNLDSSSYFTDGVGVVGYGPYTLTEWAKGQSITFEKNENCGGEEPAWDRSNVRYEFASAQMQNAMLTGGIGMGYLFGVP